MPRLIQIQRPSAARGADARERDGAPPQPLSSAAAAQLQQYAAARRRTVPGERCEFCGTGIDDQHGHLVDLGRRALLCVCRPCYLLFVHDGAGGLRFRAVPDRYLVVPELCDGREPLDALQVPIGLAFFFVNSATHRVTAFYPSPAGATESELPLDGWADVVSAAPSLAALAADVEALLVRRTDARVDALIVPIDACYELVGRIRRAWQGLQGGDDVPREIDEFFSAALERARRGAIP